MNGDGLIRTTSAKSRQPMLHPRHALIRRHSSIRGAASDNSTVSGLTIEQTASTLPANSTSLSPQEDIVPAVDPSMQDEFSQLRNAFAAALDDSILRHLASYKAQASDHQQFIAPPDIVLDDTPVHNKCILQTPTNAINTTSPAAKKPKSFSSSRHGPSLDNFISHIIRLLHKDVLKCKNVSSIYKQASDASLEMEIMRKENLQLRAELSRLKARVYSVDEIVVTNQAQLGSSNQPDPSLLTSLQQSLNDLGQDITTARKDIHILSKFKDDTTAHRRSTNLTVYDIKDRLSHLEKLTKNNDWPIESADRDRSQLDIQFRLDKLETDLMSADAEALVINSRLEEIPHQLKDVESQFRCVLARFEVDIRQHIKVQDEMYAQLQEECRNALHISETEMDGLRKTLSDFEAKFRTDNANVLVSDCYKQLLKDHEQSLESKLACEIQKVVTMISVLGDSTVVSSADLSTEDREDLTYAITKAQLVDPLVFGLAKLQKLYEKLDFVTQWQNHRFDNLTNETIARDMTGIIAPLLPRFQKTLNDLKADVHALRVDMVRISSFNETGVLQDGKIETVQKNLDSLAVLTTERLEKLEHVFKEARDNVIADLQALKCENTEFSKKRKHLLAKLKGAGKDTRREEQDFDDSGSIADDHAPSPKRKAPTNEARCPRSKSGSNNLSYDIVDLCLGDTSDPEEVDEAQAAALLSSFQKPAQAVHSSLPTSTSDPAAKQKKRKRKRAERSESPVRKTRSK